MRVNRVHLPTLVSRCDGYGRRPYLGVIIASASFLQPLASFGLLWPPLAAFGPGGPNRSRPKEVPKNVQEMVAGLKRSTENALNQGCSRPLGRPQGGWES